MIASNANNRVRTTGRLLERLSAPAAMLNSIATLSKARKCSESTVLM